MQIDVVGIGFLIVLGVLVPWAAVRGARRLDAGLVMPSRTRFLLTTLGLQAALAVFAIRAADSNRIQLFAPAPHSGRDLLLALAAFGVLLGWIAAGWRSMSPARRARLALFLPETRSEHALYALVVLAAGVGEELAYRGVLFALLARLTGNAWIGAALAALLFGAAHSLQGGRSALVVGGFALVFQALAALTGALYASMLVHVAYDLTAGVIYPRLLRSARSARAPLNGPGSASAPT